MASTTRCFFICSKFGMINCTSNVHFFCNRKTTSHKVRTKSSPVRKHLQRNLKLDRAKLHKNSMRLTKPSWRPRQSHPLSQVHRHRYYGSRSSLQVRIWSCLVDLSFYLSSFTSHITNYCTKDILNNLYKIGCDLKQSKLCFFRRVNGTAGWYWKGICLPYALWLCKGLTAIL